MDRPVLKTHSVIAKMCVLVIGLVLAFLFFAVCPPSENSDYVGCYRPVAERILAGHGITDVDGRPATRYPLGYPLFIAACYVIADSVDIDREQGMLWVQVFIYALSGVLIYLMAERVFAHVIPCGVATIFWLINPFNLWLLKQVNSEIPFILFLYLALWLTLHCITIDHAPTTAKSSCNRLLIIGLCIGIFSGIRC